MNNFQIDLMLYSNPFSGPLFGGTAPWDIFAEKYATDASDKRLFVVNTHSSDEPGEHWVAVWRPPHSATSHFFDSYGFTVDFYPRIRAALLADRLRPDIVSLAETLQHPSTDVCGDYCVAYCIAMAKGVSPGKFAEYWRSFDDPDSLVRDLVETDIARIILNSSVA